MFLAEKTVKNYVSSLLAKLGMERRTQAAVFAAKHPPNVAGPRFSEPGKGRPSRSTETSDAGPGQRALGP